MSGPKSKHHPGGHWRIKNSVFQGDEWRQWSAITGKAEAFYSNVIFCAEDMLKTNLSPQKKKTHRDESAGKERRLCQAGAGASWS